MKNRGHTSAVNKGPERGHVLLAAFLEATSRIDRRALQRPVSPIEAAEAVSLEANPTSLETRPASLEVHPALLEVDPTSLEAQLISTAPKAAPFTFRRANLVRA